MGKAFKQPNWMDLTFKRSDVRLQCERELKADLIRLRQGYITAGGKDPLIGEVREMLRPDDVLILCADHGFQSFRREVHLNNWLHEKGYLALEPGLSKANTNMALLHLLAQTDCRIDAVSDNEVRLCLGAGFSPDRILFTGGNTPMDDIEFLARHKVARKRNIQVVCEYF